MTPLRHRQQVAAAFLAYLLTRDLPLMEWELSTHPQEPALLGRPCQEYTPAEEADAIRQWAAATGLPAPTYTPDDGIGGMYESHGAHQSVLIRVHAWLQDPPRERDAP
jgi:hypothetical protein